MFVLCSMSQNKHTDGCLCVCSQPAPVKTSMRLSFVSCNASFSSYLVDARGMVETGVGEEEKSV